MNYFLKFLINVFFVRPLKYLRTKSFSYNYQTVYEAIWDRATLRSAIYIENNLHNALLFPSKFMLWDYSIKKIENDGLFLEFGVHRGDSINYFATRYSNEIYGFDSFEGLREDWFGTISDASFFSLKKEGLPKVKPNVKLIKGWFHNTLPKFLENNSKKISFLHMDADTYESTYEVLTSIAALISVGTIIVFDEYLGYPNWENGEFKAWQEFTRLNNLNYMYIGFSNKQAAIRIV